MGRRMRLALAALFVLLLVPGIADAQLRRGDSGEEVMELQQLLLGTGWLFEEPDGVFGRRTEQAVRQYEAHAGLKADGIADETMLAALRSDYAALNGLMPGDTQLPGICIFLTADDSSSAVVYCSAHEALLDSARALLESGSAQDARRACALWREEITQLYNRWMTRTDQSQHGGITQARAQFFAMIDAQEQAITAYYGTFQVDPGDAAPYAALQLQLREHTAWLCALISGALTGYDGPEL